MKTQKKILIFWPNSGWFDKRRRPIMPNTILVLTRVLTENGFAPELLDANVNDYTFDECQAILQEKQPDIVLISGLAYEYWQHCFKSMEMAKKANPRVVTIMGGVLPTTLPSESLQCKDCDYIYIGPAEDRFPQMLRRVIEGDFDAVRAMPGIGYVDSAGQPVINPHDITKSILRHPPEPDYSLMDMEKYLTPFPSEWVMQYKKPTAMITTSYGCYYNCVFCSAKTIRGHKYSYREAKNVLQEIRWLYHEYGVRHFSFIDELFLAKRDRVEEILNGIIDEKLDIKWKCGDTSVWHLDEEMITLMSKAGCTDMIISVESGTKRVLKEIIRKPVDLEKTKEVVKFCKTLPMRVASNFVIGFPGETWDEIRQTIRYAEELDIDLVIFHIATPMPATDLYYICKEQGLLPENFSFFSPEFFAASRGFISTDEFTPSELAILRTYEWDRINFSTPERTAVIADMFNTTVEELNLHRKKNRAQLGAFYLSKS